MSDSIANILVINNKTIRLDKRGYLQNLSDWDKGVAEALAIKEGLELDQGHWEVIELLRSFHQQSGLVPSTRALVKLMAKDLGESKGKSMYLMKLFPQTPLKLACKIAGLPRPINCI
tara:strand:+ start:260309 stop:260659 length:351 start_codon:yes stop_codon:yes gene_type:complete